MLIDNHKRPINYVRLAVTDRCNLRCLYCMPESGIKYAPKRELLTQSEMIRIISLLVDQGITKVRITGGEPFLWKDTPELLEHLHRLTNLQQLTITTNGTLTIPHIPLLEKLSIKNINFSLDSLNSDNFFRITRRNLFDEVWKCFNMLISAGFTVKINCVVMSDYNTHEIVPFVALTKELPISVRFIEEMPFNGHGKSYDYLEWHYKRILAEIQSTYPQIEKIKDPQYSTSLNYKIPGYQGDFGIIPAYSRTFCGSCNRIRITPDGTLKTCLYDQGIFNIKNLMRAGASNDELTVAIKEAISARAKDGFEAERTFRQVPVSESMTTIGG